MISKTLGSGRNLIDPIIILVTFLFNCYEYMLIVLSYLFTQMNTDSINSSYFLWPKRNKKPCRKKAIFVVHNHDCFSA